MSVLLDFLIHKLLLKGYSFYIENDTIINAMKITIRKENKYYKQVINYIDILDIKYPESFIIDKINYMIKCIDEDII